MSHSPERSTIKKLFALSGNVCAFPECSVNIVNMEYGTVVGEICHIKGRRPDAPRYDPSQTDTERNAFENLLILCPEHHKIIDENEDKFSVDFLLKMKKEHEEKVGVKVVVEDWVVDELLKK